MPARSYQQQLDHLNTVVTKMHRHKNAAIGRFKKPVIFDDWFEKTQALLCEADDEEVYTVRIEEENGLSENPTEDEKFECYTRVLKRSADLLANKKQSLRIDEYEASSKHYLCAGDREYEIIGNTFRVDGEVVGLEPKEMKAMIMVLKDGHRDILATDMASEIWGDSQYVIEAPHLISDINTKIKRGQEMPNPLARIAGVSLPLGRRGSIWHLYLRNEPREGT